MGLTERAEKSSGGALTDSRARQDGSGGSSAQRTTTDRVSDKPVEDEDLIHAWKVLGLHGTPL